MKRAKGKWSPAAKVILQERYLTLPNGLTKETPEDMCWRVAEEVGSAEKKNPKLMTTKFYNMLVDNLFLPNSPTLMNAGKKNGLQYAACFVLPVGDSMEEIFDAIKTSAIIHKSGGGTGFSFDELRPAGSLVRTTGGTSSGPISFLEVFDAATNAVKQGGTRRGANMAVLRVDHPDIFEFVATKRDGGVTNFNLSVSITDEFMNAYRNNEKYDLTWGGKPTRKVSAVEMFDCIVDAAWETGDPGMFFVDQCNRGSANPVPESGPVVATNPCGEQPLYPNEACNLGSINLAKFYNAKGGINWKHLGKTVDLAVRFLDNIIEVCPYPLPEIDKTVRANRRIGLGVMGWADLLYLRQIPYDSETALRMAEEVMYWINARAHDASVELTKERGVFPNYMKSIYNSGRPRRNATVTTIAPTGTISIIANCSSGIEPVFALSYTHAVGSRVLQVTNPAFQRVAKSNGVYTPMVRKVVQDTGRVLGCPDIPDELQRVFVTAHDIAPAWHVRMQAAFQKNTDNGVSKTINLPNSATREDVKKAFLMAYELGCVGITVFRDGCKKGVLSPGCVTECDI